MSGLVEWVLRDGDGREIPLPLMPGEPVMVGRDFTSDVPIPDAGVSREHARITLEGDELWLEDLHSQNGTFVNTERIYRARINSGDIITLGRVHLTLTSRKPRGEENDPLRRLSQETLASLLRATRELYAKRGRSLIFKRILDLGVERLKAERGAILLWDEARSTFHCVVALPSDFVVEAPRLISGPLGQAILHGGAARLLHPGASSLEAGAVLPQIRSGSAMAASLLAESRPLGVLYLDRGKSQPGFELEDVEHLSAIAWVASGALAERPRERKEEEGSPPGEPLRGIRRSGPGVVGWEGPDEQASPSLPTLRVEGARDGLEELFLELEASLEEARKQVAMQDPGSAEKVLGAACLQVEALSRLLGRQSARLEEIQIALALADAAASSPASNAASNAASSPGRTICRVKEGGDLSVTCAPDVLILSLRLAIHSLLPAELAHGKRSDPSNVEPPSAPPPHVLEAAILEATAARSPTGQAISIRLSRSPRAGEKDPLPAKAGVCQDLSRELTRRLVTEQMGGQLQAASDRSSLELTFPQGALVKSPR